MIFVDRETFAIKLKNGRIASGLTQKNVADILNRPQQTIGAWEVGRSQPDINTLSKLLQLYHISANDFFQLDEESILPITLEEKLKSLISEKYGSMKNFAHKTGIPNSTLCSMFQRGIFNSTIGKVIQLTSALNISIEELIQGNIVFKIHDAPQVNKDFYKSQIDDCYTQLNDKGKIEAYKRISELTEISRYILHSGGNGFNSKFTKMQKEENR